MVIINGQVFHGNVTIVNGQVISENSCEHSEMKKFDEIKEESAKGIRRITINSDVTIKVSSSNTTDKIIAHLHGSTIPDNNFKLSISRFDDEIKISVESKKSGSTISIGNCSHSININNINFGGCNSPTLDIVIPNQAFEKICAEGYNSNIDLTSSVDAKNIELTSHNGNINVSEASFKSLNISTHNGNINVSSEAYCDITMKITSHNGNVDVSLGDIGTSQVSIYSKNGNTHNKPRLTGNYSVCGFVKSYNGNVKFH